jgi:hypothetical protein
MLLPRYAFVVFVLAAGIAACGGGGGGGAMPSTGGGGSQTSSHPAVTLRMVIPNATQIAVARRKKPAYVSPSVASVVYTITTTSGTTSLVNGANYTNIATPSPCTTGSSGLTCNISISATLPGSGTYDVTIATYDAPQTATCTPGGTGCSGNLLGLATLPETITVGSTTPLAVTLGGIPAYLQGVSLTGYANGNNNNNSNNEITIFGPSPQTGVAELLDADMNVIIPPGAPTISVTSQNPSAVTATAASPSPGLYSLTWTAVKSGSYVQPGSYTVTLAWAIPGTSLSSTFPITVRIAHSGVFVGTCNDSHVADVYGYLDGNTNGSSPDLTIASGLQCSGTAPGVATDGVGDLYVADGLNVFEYAVAPGSNPSPMWTAGSSQGLSMPVAVALDGYDNVYVGDASSGLLAFNSPSPSGLAAPVITIPNRSFNSCNIGGVAADNAGNLYIAVKEDGDFDLYHLPSLQGGLSSMNDVPTVIATLPPTLYNAGASIAVDVQPSPSTSPNIWTAGQSPPNYDGTLWNWTAAGALLNTYASASLGTEVEGVAVDGNGTVYAAYGGRSYGVVTLAPPSYTIGTSPITPPAVSPINISVGVAPAAGILGNRTGGGSPIPLGTPAAVHRP